MDVCLKSLVEWKYKCTSVSIYIYVGTAERTDILLRDVLIPSAMPCQCDWFIVACSDKHYERVQHTTFFLFTIHSIMEILPFKLKDAFK